MKAKQIYLSTASSHIVAEMEDGSLRFVSPGFSGLQEKGPNKEWFDRGKEAGSLMPFPFLVPLLEGVMEKRSAISELARKGGSARSEAKTAASRENGKKGGRPPKNETGGNKMEGMELRVQKDGKDRVLTLENDGKKHYALYITYPDGQKVKAKVQPVETTHIPDIKWYAKENGFEPAE